MAKTTWGRKETIVWPQYRLIYTYGAVFAAILLTALFLYVRLRFLSTPLQWFYTPIYARTSIFGPFSRTHRSQSQLLFLTGDRPRHCPNAAHSVSPSPPGGLPWAPPQQFTPTPTHRPG